MKTFLNKELNILGMNSEIEFYDKFYNLKLLNRLKFFIMIWNNGSFKDKLENILQLESDESISFFAEVLSKNGFLTIDKTNPNEFYFISEGNFKNIFNHIYERAKMPKDENMYFLLKDKRKEITPDLIENLSYELSNNNLFEEKNLIILLEKNIAFLFIFIIGLKEEIRKDKQFNDYYIETILKLLKYQTSVYSLNPDESADDFKHKREFLRESVRVQLSWRM